MKNEILDSAMFEDLETQLKKIPDGYVVIMHKVGEAVATDWRELITCKDCKHCFVDGDNVRYNACDLNHNNAQMDNWYCADAERKQGWKR